MGINAAGSAAVQAVASGGRARIPSQADVGSEAIAKSLEDEKRGGGEEKRTCGAG